MCDIEGSCQCQHYIASFYLTISNIAEHEEAALAVAYAVIKCQTCTSSLAGAWNAAMECSYFKWQAAGAA